jgi:uncharacterized protein with von Willebrand factor type A (vWA) domain
LKDFVQQSAKNEEMIKIFEECTKKNEKTKTFVKQFFRSSLDIFSTQKSDAIPKLCLEDYKSLSEYIIQTTFVSSE